MSENAIKGYRNLSEAEGTLINRIKDVGEQVEELLHHALAAGADPRWMAIAKTHLQLGFMSATRSIAKPETFA
jgi:hypothetical protein